MGRRGPIPQRSVIKLPDDLAAMPVAPKGTSAEARKFWREVGPELHKLGLLTMVDAIAFELLAETWADLERLRRIIDREGMMIERGGELRRHPLVGVELR